MRFLMIGGFLGAGKTTTLARLARMYQDRGENVGIVTNDQAADLVDTHMLRSQGFEVGEVAGACFCCNFNELTATTEKLEAKNQPDLILAEPVGSCTDLVATVVQPLRRLFDEKFDVGPYGVIVKPSHGRKILRGEEGGFSSKAEYIFRKQLEEADFLLVNRIDELPAAEVDELVELVEAEFPGTPILRVSARTGQGFEALLEFLDQEGDFGRRILDLDYDIYAEGEAELGWLNASIKLSADEAINLDAYLLDVLKELRDSLEEYGAETAHMKTIGLWEGFYGVANLVSRSGAAELSLPSHCRTKEADVIVNARVAIDPETLADLVRGAVARVAERLHARADVRGLQSFRPRRPVPTHRFAEAV